jgi:hypothetical protein
MRKSVKFGSRNFYPIVDHLYLSDQIGSFDESIIHKYNIKYFINCTRKAPFLFNDTTNIHLHYLNSINHYTESKLNKKIDKTIDYIHRTIKQNHNVLVYCENGIDKSLVIIICYLLKYYKISNYNFNQIIDLVNNKVGTNTINQCINLNICKNYRNHLVELDWQRSNSSNSTSIEDTYVEKEKEKENQTTSKGFISFLKKHISSRI